MIYGISQVEFLEGKSINSLSLSHFYSNIIPIIPILSLLNIIEPYEITLHRFPINMAMGHHCLSQVRPRILEALVETPPRLEEVKLKKSTDIPIYPSCSVITWLAGKFPRKSMNIPGKSWENTL